MGRKSAQEINKLHLGILQPFIRAVRKKFSPARVVLFGSRAKGTAHAQSDFDILIVSPRFKGIEFSRRSVLAYRLKRDIPAAMDIICLTPEEFKERSQRLTVIREISSEGIDITAAV